VIDIACRKFRDRCKVAFAFKYASLLNYRKHLKEIAEVAFSKAQSELRLQEMVLEACRDQLKKGTRSLGVSLKRKMSSDDLKAYLDYLNGLNDKIGSQQEAVERCQAVVTEKRAALLTRTKEYRMIEKLKEKDLQKWKEKQRLLEQKTMDETAIMRHGRRFI